MSTILFTENNKWILLITVSQYVYFIHLTAPVYSQGWNICGKKRIEQFFPGGIQSHQLPLCRSAEHILYCTFTCWVSASAARPNKERALVFATRCQSRVQDHGLDQLHRVNRKLVLLQGRECVLSVYHLVWLVPSFLLVQEIQAWSSIQMASSGLWGYCGDEQGLRMDSGSQGSQPKGRLCKMWN